MSPNKEVTKGIGKIYPGRASSAPIIDLFITLLSMGLDGYKGLLAKRKSLLDSFQTRFGEVAERHGGRILNCPRNTISFGITLDTLSESPDEIGVDSVKESSLDTSYFGSMLFMRCVSGTRVVPRGQTKTMGKHSFEGFGSSTDNYQHDYLTAACAIGGTECDLDEFFSRLDKAFKDFKKKRKKKAAKTKKGGIH